MYQSLSMHMCDVRPFLAQGLDRCVSRLTIFTHQFGTFDAVLKLASSPVFRPLDEIRAIEINTKAIWKCSNKSYSCA